MKIDFNNYEYNEIVYDIINNREFKKIELCPHHKGNRLEHSKRVSYISYRICKVFNLDYVSGFSSDGKDIIMNNGEKIPLSKNFKKSFTNQYFANLHNIL